MADANTDQTTETNVSADLEIVQAPLPNDEARPSTVLNCMGQSEVVGRTRSGRVVRSPARYVPTMDSTPYGALDLAELDPEELAAVEEGDTDDIESEGEEEEQDEKELDAELAKEEPNEMDRSFVVQDKPKGKRRKAEEAWQEPDDVDYQPAPEEVKVMEAEEEADVTESDAAPSDDEAEDDEEASASEEEEEAATGKTTSGDTKQGE